MLLVELLLSLFKYGLEQTHKPPMTELLIKSCISMSFICSIFTPENFNIQSFVNEGDDIYLEQSNPNLSQIPFLKFSKISVSNVISNFKYVSRYSFMFLNFNLL